MLRRALQPNTHSLDISIRLRRLRCLPRLFAHERTILLNLSLYAKPRPVRLRHISDDITWLRDLYPQCLAEFPKLPDATNEAFTDAPDDFITAWADFESTWPSQWRTLITDAAQRPTTATLRPSIGESPLPSPPSTGDQQTTHAINTNTPPSVHYLTTPPIHRTHGRPSYLQMPVLPLRRPRQTCCIASCQRQAYLEGACMALHTHTLPSLPTRAQHAYATS